MTGSRLLGLTTLALLLGILSASFADAASDNQQQCSTASRKSRSSRSAKQSVSVCTYPKWVSGQDYCEGERVSHKLHSYEAKWCTRAEPGTEDPDWGSWTDNGICKPTACPYDKWVSGQDYCKGEELEHWLHFYEPKWCTRAEPGTEDPDWGSWTNNGICTRTS